MTNLSDRSQALEASLKLQWKDSFYMDNANLLKAPSYELVNVNVHYKTDLLSDYFRSLNLFLEVRNVFDRTYVASAKQYLELRHGRRRSKSCERARKHDGIDLRGLAACLRCGYEGGIQMIPAFEGTGAMIRSGLLGILTLAFLQSAAHGQMHGQHGSEAACEEPALRCATKVTPAFGSDGTLWLAWMAGGCLPSVLFRVRRTRDAAFQPD